MGNLTTHILDTSLGRPAAGILVEVYRANDTKTKLAEGVTNADGRLDAPLLEGHGFKTGAYQLVFKTGEYFNNNQGQSADFLDEVVIRFNVADANEHYHVPLLLSPFGYSTYRGS